MIYLCPWLLKSKTGALFKVSLEFECNLSCLTVKPDASFMDFFPLYSVIPGHQHSAIKFSTSGYNQMSISHCLVFG